jgi:hypothetical protein
MVCNCSSTPMDPSEATLCHTLVGLLWASPAPRAHMVAGQRNTVLSPMCLQHGYKLQFDTPPPSLRLLLFLLIPRTSEFDFAALKHLHQGDTFDMYQPLLPNSHEILSPTRVHTQPTHQLDDGMLAKALAAARGTGSAAFGLVGSSAVACGLVGGINARRRGSITAAEGF